MARCLIIGCGCRGRSLARELRRVGHAVRGTTRDPRMRAEIERAGAEPFLADPDRVATVGPALEHVSVVCLLLGSAVGSPSQLRALHGPRLEMLLARVVDSPVRGFVYEANGTVDASALACGVERVRELCEGARLNYAVLDEEPTQNDRWVAHAAAAVEGALR